MSRPSPNNDDNAGGIAKRVEARSGGFIGSKLELVNFEARTEIRYRSGSRRKKKMVLGSRGSGIALVVEKDIIVMEILRLLRKTGKFNGCRVWEAVLTAWVKENWISMLSEMSEIT